MGRGFGSSAESPKSRLLCRSIDTNILVSNEADLPQPRPEASYNYVKPIGQRVVLKNDSTLVLAERIFRKL